MANPGTRISNSHTKPTAFFIVERDTHENCDDVQSTSEKSILKACKHDKKTHQPRYVQLQLA